MVVDVKKDHGKGRISVFGFEGSLDANETLTPKEYKINAI